MIKLKKKDVTKTILITSIIGVLFLIIGLTDRNFNYASKVYQVYLNGNKLGLIKNQEELYALINEEQKDIKDAYEVETVYPPNGFVVKEYNTYNEKITSAKDIYEKIKDEDDFTIQGYIIKIKFNEEENTIEIL